MSGHPLVTGATGFAGSHLLDRLLQDHPEVHAWANASGRPIARHDPRVRWTAIDLLDRRGLTGAISAAQPSVIYHCAGIADVHGSWRAPARALEVNVIGTHNVLEAARAAGFTGRVLVTGSALVYQPSLAAISEDDPIGPTTPYGVSKLAQEMAAERSGLDVLLARPFNHAGTRQDDSYVTSAFARQIAAIERGGAAPVLHVGNLDSRRDITDVRDVADAYVALTARGTPRRPYNVCRGIAYRVGDLLDMLLSRARVRISVEMDPSRLRPSDNPVVLGSHARVTAETGWSPRIPIEQTLADVLDYWRACGAAA